MSKSESWKVWTAVILILLFSGFVAAVWPYLGGLGGGGAARIPVETEIITINIPPLAVVGFEGLVFEINSFLIFLIMAGAVVVSVIVVGVVLTGINFLISRQVTKTINSEKYQEGNAALEQHEKDKLSKKREGREAATAQQNDYSHWAVIATSLIVLMFAVFLGYLVGDTLFPGRELMRQDQIINITGIIIIAFVLISLLVLLLRINPRKLAAVNETDYGTIPWESITVILLGALILGLGIGFVIFLNLPQ